MVQKLAWVFAVVFLAVGILGFVPGITSEGHLLGIFAVDTIHNVIHLLAGVLALLVAWKWTASAGLYFKAFGLVYLLVAVIGFLMGGESILGIFAANMADHVLHVVLAVAMVYIGFFMKSEDAAAPMA